MITVSNLFAETEIKYSAVLLNYSDRDTSDWESVLFEAENDRQ